MWWFVVLFLLTFTLIHTFQINSNAFLWFMIIKWLKKNPKLFPHLISNWNLSIMLITIDNVESIRNDDWCCHHFISLSVDFWWNDCVWFTLHLCLNYAKWSSIFKPICLFSANKQPTKKNGEKKRVKKGLKSQAAIIFPT